MLRLILFKCLLFKNIDDKHKLNKKLRIVILFLLILILTDIFMSNSKFEDEKPFFKNDNEKKYFDPKLGTFSLCDPPSVTKCDRCWFEGSVAIKNFKK